MRRRKDKIASSHITAKCIRTYITESKLEKTCRLIPIHHSFLGDSKQQYKQGPLSFQSTRTTTCAASLAIQVSTKRAEPQQNVNTRHTQESCLIRSLDLWEIESMGVLILAEYCKESGHNHICGLQEAETTRFCRFVCRFEDMR
jgi:hypothetical protein